MKSGAVHTGVQAGHEPTLLAGEELRDPEPGSAAVVGQGCMRELGLRREEVSRQDIRSDPNQTLPEVLAAVQPRDRTRCLLDSVEDVLSIADLSVAHPALEFPQCLGTALNMVKDEKPLHSRSFDEKMTLDPWALG